MTINHRGKGLTMTQLREAPSAAGFVWCNDNLSYPINLARYLGRVDLQIYPPRILDTVTEVGTRQLILDHALPAILTRRRHDAYEAHNAYIQNTLPNKDRKKNEEAQA